MSVGKSWSNCDIFCLLSATSNVFIEFPDPGSATTLNMRGEGPFGIKIDLPASSLAERVQRGKRLEGWGKGRRVQSAGFRALSPES